MSPKFLPKATATYQIVTAAYKIDDLTPEELKTLMWLSDRGYDAGIFELAPGEETEDGGYRFEEIPENVAWEIQEKYNDDPDAFLTSNGSRTLAEKLNRFLESIV